MSTVIYCNKAIYSDTQTTRSKQSADGDVDVSKIMVESKMKKIGNSIFGFTGCIGAIEDFTCWAENGYQKKNTKKIKNFIEWLKGNPKLGTNRTLYNSFRAIEYDGNSVRIWTIKRSKSFFGRIFGVYYFAIYSDTSEDEVNWKAIGSGSQYAAGALELVNNPLLAIWVASSHDYATNSIVERITLQNDNPETLFYETFDEAKKHYSLQKTATLMKVL